MPDLPCLRPFFELAVHKGSLGGWVAFETTHQCGG